VVFEGAGPADPRVQLHLCFSGHIGDVPWTAVIARACAHSSFKGCPRCFQVGTTCNSQGEALGCVRLLGYLEDTLVQKLEINADVAIGNPGCTSWVDSTVCYTKLMDGEVVFDQDAANDIRVTNDQHRLRAQKATKLMRDKILLHPMRDRQYGESIEAWEEGKFIHPTLTSVCSCSLECKRSYSYSSSLDSSYINQVQLTRNSTN
jgi:hypothetical protein